MSSGFFIWPEIGDFFATYHFWVSLMVGCLVYVVERNLCVVDLQSNTKYMFFNFLFANPQRQGKLIIRISTYGLYTVYNAT